MAIGSVKCVITCGAIPVIDRNTTQSNNAQSHATMRLAQEDVHGYSDNSPPRAYYYH